MIPPLLLIVFILLAILISSFSMAYIFVTTYKPSLDGLTIDYTVTSTFGDGSPTGTLWHGHIFGESSVVLAADGPARVFTALAAWLPQSMPTAGATLFFTLPEPAGDIRTLIANQIAITYPTTPPVDGMRAVLIDPSKMKLEFTENGQPTGLFLTSDYINTFFIPQAIGISVIFTTL